MQANHAVATNARWSNPVMVSSKTVKFEDMQPRNHDDEACISEVRAILMKYGKIDRFGLFLMHNHFPVSEDEVLKEDWDEAARIATVRPVKLAALDQAETVDTMWDLRSDRAVMKCSYGKCD